MYLDIPPKPNEFPTLPDASPAIMKYKATDLKDNAPFDISAYLKGDKDVCQMVAKMSPSWSRNGKFYTKEALKDMINQINGVGVVCHAGHINKETRAWEFFEEVGIWTGALYDEKEQAAYFKGYIRPDKENIKRSLRSGVINRISIEGVGTYQGDIVVAFDLRSIDLTNRFANATDSPVASEMIEKGGSEMPEDERKDGDTLEGTVNADAQEKHEAQEQAKETASDKEPNANDEKQHEETETSSASMEEIIKELEEIKLMLGGDNLKDRITELKAIEATVKKNELDSLVSASLAEQVDNDTARRLIQRIGAFKIGMTKEEVSEQIKVALNDKLVQEVINATPTTRFRLPKTSNPSDTPKGLQIIYTKEGE